VTALDASLEILEMVEQPEGGEFLDIEFIGVLDPALVNALTKQYDGST
jgi:hypothetical protein